MAPDSLEVGDFLQCFIAGGPLRLDSANDFPQGLAIEVGPVKFSLG